MGEAIIEEPAVRYLQWLMDGKTQGTVVSITGIEAEGDDKYYTLSDGGRVNIEAVGSKVIKEVVSPEHKYRFKKVVHKPAPMKEIKGADGEMYYAPDETLTFQEQQGWTETKIIPPAHKPSTDSTLTISSGMIVNEPAKPIKATIDDPFVMIMDDIQLEEHLIQIDMDAEMLPYDFFDMNAKYMEDGESKMVKYLVDKILNTDDLKSMVEKSVKLFYKLKKDENDK